MTHFNFAYECSLREKKVLCFSRRGFSEKKEMVRVRLVVRRKLRRVEARSRIFIIQIGMVKNGRFDHSTGPVKLPKGLFFALQ